jgi:hypothetical protein
VSHGFENACFRSDRLLRYDIGNDATDVGPTEISNIPAAPPRRVPQRVADGHELGQRDRWPLPRPPTDLLATRGDQTELAAASEWDQRQAIDQHIRRGLLLEPVRRAVRRQ